MKFSRLFPDAFLSSYLSDFKLSEITNIRKIRQLIGALIKELESGKLDSLKEEEFKSRFISTFFGDILGFNYGNFTKWFLREERKSTTNGTKPDGALGYFYIDKEMDKVRAVIEIKDATTDLDIKQKRADSKTPVDQAFGYAPIAMGGKCDWVIVSNFKEIRFYPARERGKCQVFLLNELSKEAKLKELLYLFHKDRFILEKRDSNTDRLYAQTTILLSTKVKPIHIIDKMYESINKFKGLSFVDPNYISTLYPFNILKKHVWHYNTQELFTLNPEIFNLIKNIEIQNDKILFTKELQEEIEEYQVVEAKFKLKEVFSFLNYSCITKITAVKDYTDIKKKRKTHLGFSLRHVFHIEKKDELEGLMMDISMHPTSCDCLSCNYRLFDIKKILEKLKVSLGNNEFNTMEYAYGNYIVASNNYKTTYSILKNIELESKGVEGKEIEYFLSKKNQKHLFNLVKDYQQEDKEIILSDIKSIDLDKIIHDEIEFYVDGSVTKYLKEIRDDKLIYKLQDEIYSVYDNLIKLEVLYANGGKQGAGPHLPTILASKYQMLYLHTNANYIIFDVFTRYKNLTEKVFEGLVIALNLPEYGIKSIHDFYLTEAILHIPTLSLKRILKKTSIISVEENCCKKMLNKLDNYLNSLYRDGIWGGPHENAILSEQLNYSRFLDTYSTIFANFFSIFSIVPLTRNLIESTIPSLIKFLKVENFLTWAELEPFCDFIKRKGNLFTSSELENILKIALDGYKYHFTKYPNLIKSICIALSKYHYTFKISNKHLINIALMKCSSDDGLKKDFEKVLPLANVSDENCSKLIFDAIEEYLDNQFSSNLYEYLIKNTSYDFNKNDYFKVYTEDINNTKNGRSYRFGTMKQTSLIFINYVYSIYLRGIDFNRDEFSLLSNLNEFESWIINPTTFNYQKFDAKWLIDLDDNIILDRLKEIPEIGLAIEKQLKMEFNPILARIKYTYFS